MGNQVSALDRKERKDDLEARFLPPDNFTLVYTHTIRRMINTKYSCIAPKTLPLNINQVEDFKNRIYVLKDILTLLPFFFSDK